jgi:hypothetical protein
MASVAVLVEAANRFQSASIFFDPEPEEEIGRFVATAHRLLIIAFCVLRDGGDYRELGDNYFTSRNA